METNPQNRRTTQYFVVGLLVLILANQLVQITYWISQKVFFIQLVPHLSLIVLAIPLWLGSKVKWGVFINLFLGLFSSFYVAGANFSFYNNAVAGPNSSPGNIKGNFAAWFLLFTGMLYLGAAVYLATSQPISAFIREQQSKKQDQGEKKREVPKV